MKRSGRLAAAKQTVEIVARGSYALPDGRTIDIAEPVRACLDGTRHFPAEEMNRVRRAALAGPVGAPPRIDVRNETTLAGIRRLLAEEGGPLLALNFASAKNPGGGFLNGSEAQEESLARSSALYASLLRVPDFYATHRAMTSCLYTDAMILSPACPVFRDDDGTLLDRPYAATFLTSPAPNAGAVAKNTPDDVPRLRSTLRRRAELVLAVAAHEGYDRLVLGAWGCGVFRNDPDDVAEAFAEHLHGACAGRFRRVAFAVLDTSADGHTLTAFERAFPPTP